MFRGQLGTSSPRQIFKLGDSNSLVVIQITVFCQHFEHYLLNKWLVVFESEYGNAISLTLSPQTSNRSLDLALILSNLWHHILAHEEQRNESDNCMGGIAVI